MAKYTKTRVFDSEEEVAILKSLEQMETSSTYNTQSSYVPDAEKYMGNLKTFSRKHLEHLKKFPTIDPQQYLANLRLMTRVG